MEQRGLPIHHYRTLLWVSAVVILLDQLTKAIISNTLALHQSIEVIPGFFNITHIRNPGVAFGLLKGSGRLRLAVLLIVSSVALAVVVYLYRKAEDKVLAFALSLVAGGAVGNLIDRMRFGEVVDFLDLHLGSYHWPAFNIADSAITIGVILTLLSLYIRR
ncbi:MAG: signal peptidase II [Deltaproteobacteria bacterium]|nr:signal peptidase II [Deltaproteobacteria bacterium]